MARLAQFTVNSKKIEDGDWVRPDETKYDDLEVKTRGMTNSYKDALTRGFERAARGFGGKVERVPNAIRHNVVVECVIKELVQDVRNLIGRDGQPVTFAQFCDLLRHPDCSELVEACLVAAQLVGRIHDDEAEDAAKN